ncbi:MAG: hypothetical protein Q8J68_05540 [Methanolobus sp.]|uniref:hypothetical protein n=1 Tax=Methanolobus sp. TaxID=1874737 RepID=UPI00272F2947|nr:hypothetical protein [Methanolobus sp.]MDP2216733.1 hypothetical protein [Methanolobus sp.]
MGFTSGAKTLPALINDIANQIIASSADWVDGDDTWTTTSTTNSNARRCLRYTGDANDIWVALESCNDNTAPIGSSEASYRVKGLRVTFSASWDYINRIYPAGSDDTSMTFVSFEGRGSHNSPAADLGALLLTYFLWTDSTGFVLMANPEPHATDNLQSSFICAVERLNQKEYSDGLTNFYCYARLNSGHSWMNSNRGDNKPYRHYTIVRPFAFRAQDDLGIQFWQDPTRGYALKSTGSGKVYFVKPMICNDSAKFQPIGQSELFFRFSAESGLVDGDVIAVQSATTKYLCKSLQSPDSTAFLYFAMKYVA